jgi:transcriptional regulator with XRE-family HTH domain
MTSQAFGDAVRLRRQAAAISLRELAAVVPCSPGYLSRLERGERAPNTSIAAALDRALAAGGAVLALASQPVTRTLEADIEEVDTDRRAVLQGLAAAGLAVAGWPVVAPTGWQMPRRIGSHHVADLVDITQMYRQWVNRHGGTGIRQPVAVLLERASAMFAAASDPTVRLSLLAAISDLAGLGAYIARDVGAANEAHEHYRLSLSAAQAGDHVELGAHTVVRMAGHHIELRRPHQVLTLLESARARAADRLTAGGHANQWCIQAWAHAQLGNTEATHDAVGRAEDAFTNVGTDDRPWEAQHVTEAELHSLTGAAYVELARHQPSYAQTAAQRLDKALALRSPSAIRNHSLDQVSLAEAYLRAGEIDQASYVALTALDGVHDITSGRVHLRMRQLKRAMASHTRGHPTLAEFVRRVP